MGKLKYKYANHWILDVHLYYWNSLNDVLLEGTKNFSIKTRQKMS